MKNLTPELIAKAKVAKSAAELLELAKANSVALTEEEAKIYFEQLNATGVVSDEELDVVSGGSEEDEKKCGEDTIKAGDRLKLTGGVKCADCGSTIGVAIGSFGLDKIHTSGYSRPLCVVCANCDRLIFDTIDVPYIEKM